MNSLETKILLAKHKLPTQIPNGLIIDKMTQNEHNYVK